MKQKAQALINSARWVEETHGKAALDDVVRRCSPPVRQRLAENMAIDWHPFDELMEFFDVCEQRLGTGDGRVAEEMGAFGARANLRGVFLKIAQYLAKPEFLMRRVAGLWRQFNDEGELRVLHFEDRNVQLEMVGLPTPHRWLCASLNGWMVEVSRAVGLVSPTVRHSQCRAQGDARCIWEIRAVPSGR